MRNTLLAASMIILQSFAAQAEEPMQPTQPIQMSDAQWTARAYPAQQPGVQAQPVQATSQNTPIAANTPDLTNSWDVMQFNFGM